MGKLTLTRIKIISLIFGNENMGQLNDRSKYYFSFYRENETRGNLVTH